MQTRKALFVLSAMLIAGAATAQTAATTPAPQPAPQRATRADVQQDLDAWKKSGMADLTRGEQSPDVYSDEYQRRLARYHELRRKQSTH